MKCPALLESKLHQQSSKQTINKETGVTCTLRSISEGNLAGLITTGAGQTVVPADRRAAEGLRRTLVSVGGEAVGRPRLDDACSARALHAVAGHLAATVLGALEVRRVPLPRLGALWNM